MPYEEIVNEAKSRFPEVEAVVSVYSLQILWVNQKLADVAGYTREELVDKSIKDVVEIDNKTFLSFISGRDNETRTILTKSGERLKGTTAIRVFTFAGEPYFATYGSSFGPID